MIRSLRSVDDTADSSQITPHDNLEFPGIEQTVTQSPATLRHFLELHRKWTSLKAANKSANSDLAYFRSRQSKIEEIPAKHRAPKELELATQNVDLAAKRITTIQESLTILSLEANRFVSQCRAQNSNSYQFVQSAGAVFVPRSAIKRQEAMMSAVASWGAHPINAVDISSRPLSSEY